MKYTARHIRRFIDQGKIDPGLWKAHFPALLDSQVPVCHQCTEYSRGDCRRDEDPVGCLIRKTTALAPPGDEEDMRGKKSRGYHKRRLMKQHIPAGANKIFDQSKM